MSNHANDIVVLDTLDGKILVEFRGELSTHIVGLRRYVATASGVTSAEVANDRHTIIAEFELISERDTIEQVRVRIRNRCRDYIGDATGYISNTDPKGSYVDLVEHAGMART